MLGFNVLNYLKLSLKYAILKTKCLACSRFYSKINAAILFSLGVKQLGHEADHWPPTSAEVKKIWVYTSTPPYFFVVWFLIS
jgi:hypothetical protein